MTIIQPTKPPDITPDKWTSENWQYILKFLQPLDASFLFYSAINGAESLDANRKREALNAANVDKIMQMQRKQFLAQESYLHFDQETQSLFKIKTPAGQADQETQAASRSKPPQKQAKNSNDANPQGANLIPVGEIYFP